MTDELVLPFIVLRLKLMLSNKIKKPLDGVHDNTYFHVDENTPNLEDSLYASGCDDALINFRNGAVYLDFDRGAHSLEQAVLSAIKDVESASIEAIVGSVGPEDWVTESDVAKRLELKRQTVSLWTKGERRKSFPKPLMKLDDKSPLWKWCEIAEWLYAKKLLRKKKLC